MKSAIRSSLLAAALAAVPLYAQNISDVSSLIEPVESTPAAPADLPEQPQKTEPGVPATANNNETLSIDGGANQEMKKSEEGFIIKDAGLNDIFQFLAKSAGRQYFHNSKIAGPDFMVTGHLNNGNPLQQMEELAFMYGLSLHVKGNTIYALTQAQLSQLPSSEYHYQLRYLRPTDMDAIKDLIRPLLSPGTGIVNFEPKTNTIIIIDSAHRIEQAQALLHGIDKAKGQIIVETKILRINSSAAERTGVNWNNALGETGTSLQIAKSLNSIFGIDGGVTDAAFVDSNLILSPVQMNGVLRALSSGNLASQVSNPTLITEDNEQATISIIDRIPIFTTTTTASSTGAAGAEPTVTEEVRYKIDTSDKTIDSDPEKHREIGISLVVTPTLLPDGTIRMKMRPRSAQIVKYIKSITKNEYPQVTESMVESLARIPDGYSLVVGGFYGETNTDDKTKIPLLGDVPVLNFFFKSKEAIKEKTSLVFVVTPTSYNPQMSTLNQSASERIQSSINLGSDYNWVDPENPGPAHEPSLPRSIRGLQPSQAPYYPRADQLSPETAPAVSNKPSRFARGKR